MGQCPCPRHSAGQLRYAERPASSSKMHRLAEPNRRLARLAQPVRSTAQLAKQLPRSLLLHPAIPLVALGAGMWLGRDPERPARVIAHAGALIRAMRLAGCCASMAIDYRGVKRSQQQLTAANADPDAADAARHEELQRAAGRAEMRRSEAVRQGTWTQQLEDEAASTRDEAARFGEAKVARRLAREAESGAADAWRAAHERNAARLLQLCVGNGGVYVKLGQHVARTAARIRGGRRAH